MNILGEPSLPLCIPFSIQDSCSQCWADIVSCLWSSGTAVMDGPRWPLLGKHCPLCQLAAQSSGSRLSALPPQPALPCCPRGPKMESRLFLSLQTPCGLAHMCPCGEPSWLCLPVCLPPTMSPHILSGDVGLEVSASVDRSCKVLVSDILCAGTRASACQVCALWRATTLYHLTCPPLPVNLTCCLVHRALLRPHIPR